MGDVRIAAESFRPHWEHILRHAQARFRKHDWQPAPDSDDAFTVGTEQRGSALGAFDAQAFQVWAGIDQDEYALIKKAMSPSGWKTHPTLAFDLVDRVMVAAGMGYLMTSLYLVQGKGGHPLSSARRGRRRRRTSKRAWTPEPTGVRRPGRPLANLEA